MKQERIGFYGGSFNPVHWGHLLIAERFVEQFSLEKCIFIPAFKAPLKTNTINELPLKIRLEALKIAIADNPFFEINDFELKQKKTVYTIDTIHYIRDIFPLSKIYMLIGYDQLLQLEKWKEWENIIKLVQIVVAPRKSNLSINLELEKKTNAIYLNTPIIEISSTEIRERIQNRQSIQYMLPEKVEKFLSNFKDMPQF